MNMLASVKKQKTIQKYPCISRINCPCHCLSFYIIFGTRSIGKRVIFPIKESQNRVAIPRVGIGSASAVPVGRETRPTPEFFCTVPIAHVFAANGIVVKFSLTALRRGCISDVPLPFCTCAGCKYLLVGYSGCNCFVSTVTTSMELLLWIER